LFVVKPRSPKKSTATGRRSKSRKSTSSRERHRPKGTEDASLEDLGGFLAEHASEKEMSRELDKMRAEDETLRESPAGPTDVIRRRTHQPLSDFAGILSLSAAEEMRKTIDQARKEREPFDRKRLEELTEAFNRLDDVVAKTTRRQAKSTQSRGPSESNSKHAKRST
jgi:hypothetical protein